MQSTATSQRPSRSLWLRVTGFPKSSSKRFPAVGIALLLVAFGALAQQAQPVPPVIISLDGAPTNVPGSVHDFTGLPLTIDGWTDFHRMIISEGYSDARIVYVSTAGNDSTAQVYNRASAALGGQPLNPTGTVAPYRTLAAAFNQLRNGYPDVMLLRRGDSWGSTSLTFNKTGRNNAERMILAAYGPESVPRPVARVSTEHSTANVILSSVYAELPSGAIVEFRGTNLLIEDFFWSAPATTHAGIMLPCLHGNVGQGRGGSTFRRNSGSWTVLFAGWDNSLNTPSRVEENTISRSPAAISNVYFAENAGNIQSIRNQSLLSGNVNWRQRLGGVIRETIVIGGSPGMFEAMDALTFQDNMSLHVPSTQGFHALDNGIVSGNIFTAKPTNANEGMLFFRPDYQGRLGGWRGTNVFSGNIIYSGVSSGLFWVEAGFMDAFQAGATLTFDDNAFMKSNGGQIMSVFTDARVTYTNNKYYSSAANGSWFGGRTFDQMIPSTGEASAPSIYPDPDRDMVSYMRSIGANPSSVAEAIDWYSDGVPGNPSLAGALANRRGAWDERFTAIAVINYIREGFGRSQL